MIHNQLRDVMCSMSQEALPPQSIYLAGPISGRPPHEVDRFDIAARYFRERGLWVHNPTERHADPDDEIPTENEYRLESLSHIVDMVESRRLPAIVALPGWSASMGATMEVSIARDIGVPVYSLSADEFCPLDEARRIVLAGRVEAYGTPERFFLGLARRRDTRPVDEVLHMIDFKVQRLHHSPANEDTVNDLCGYAKCLALLLTKQT